MAGPGITKLNSSNYRQWSVDIRYLLLEKNLWGIVAGTEKVPEDKAILDSYNIRSNQALSLIYLNIEDNFKRIIEDSNDPVSAWKLFKTAYCPDSRSQHMRLFSDLIEIKIGANESINLFSRRLLSIYNDIKTFDKNFDEDYISFEILRFLPRKFDAIVQHILRWEADKFKFLKIVDELSVEETRLKVRDSDNTKVSLQLRQK